MKKDHIEHDSIIVQGARVHNLKNIDVEIPRNTLTVITGLSGSGKSSLAFDTLFAEGQRRYVETFSAYARNFLTSMQRPDVDKIAGLSPVISIEQKTTNRNPRSTVGTTTEIYDFLRLLYARVGEAYSYVSGEKMVKYTEEQILHLMINEYSGKRTYILAPLVNNRKGHYKDLFEQTRKKGYLNVIVDGVMQEIQPGMQLDRYKMHSIEVVVDKLIVSEQDEERLKKSLTIAMKLGNGLVMLLDVDSEKAKYYSRTLMCPTSGISYSEPAPHNFSFNSPYGACERCKGIGEIASLDMDSIVPNTSISIHDGAIAPLGKYKRTQIFSTIDAICKMHGTSINTPFSELSKETVEDIIHGTNNSFDNTPQSHNADSSTASSYEGIGRYIEMQTENETSAAARKWAQQFSKTETCPECKGMKLKKESLHFLIADKNIQQLSCMDISDLAVWLKEVEDKLDSKQRIIAKEILKEINARLNFLIDVGLDYLSLARQSASLSGGESQRIRLATQIGSQLVNVLYILDEPSIGLHQRDNMRLIRSLKELRDTGNTVIVVEHDKDMMAEADYVVDLGPKAGRHGGEIVFAGTPKQMLKAATLTSDYLNGRAEIQIPQTRRTGSGKQLILKGAKGNNLKNADATFPLGTLICVTGVSGSGKSTLINHTLKPILSQKFYGAIKDPLPYSSIEGIEHVDKIVAVDQSPIGRTPRSNPATYSGVFSDIRALFVELPESKMRGYKPGRFSFNVASGRCETCKGNGCRTIEMNFLPDVYTLCESCAGKRYNRETLEIHYKGKSIADILDMTVNRAVEFFENVPHILQKIKMIQEVGLGYIRLGQSSTTLSGGESQRIKLAAELSKKDTGNTLYVLDEPTTGLHFYDISILLDVLNKLVDRGNTVIVIEHNLDVIKSADYLIEVGPEGGKQGGSILFSGTPEQLAKANVGHTAPFLKKELEVNSPSSIDVNSYLEG